MVIFLKTPESFAFLLILWCLFTCGDHVIELGHRKAKQCWVKSIMMELHSFNKQRSYLTLERQWQWWGFLRQLWWKARRGRGCCAARDDLGGCPHPPISQWLYSPPRRWGWLTYWADDGKKGEDQGPGRWCYFALLAEEMDEQEANLKKKKDYLWDTFGQTHLA